MTRSFALAVGLLAIAATSAFAAPGFFDLGAGALPTGATTDGSVVAFDLSGANIWSNASGASVNIGSGYTTAGVGLRGTTVVVGGNSATDAQRWDGDASGVGSWTQLPKLGTVSWFARTTSAVSDNVRICGNTIAASGSQQAIRYKESSADVTAMQLPAGGGMNAKIYAVSDNGQYAGQYQVPGPSPTGARNAMGTPYAGGNMMGLYSFNGAPSTATEAIALAISRDAHFAGGWSGDGVKPILWDLSLTNGNPPFAVPMLGNSTIGEVHALNRDGSAAYGYMKTAVGPQTAFIWDATNGTRDLKTYLLGLGIAVPSSWTLNDVKGVSGDGRVLTGIGNLAGGGAHGWVIVIPEPGCVLTLCVGLTGLVGYLRRKS